MSNSVLGIDFGTSFSSVAVLFKGEIKVVHDENGSTYIPSVVCFREKEKVGAAAEHFKKKYPKNTIYEIKRIVGCRYDDAIVSRMQKIWPFSVVEGMEHRVQVEFYVNDKRRRYYPEYVISKVLKYLVGLAENVTGEKYSKAVITVPANFNDTQRKCIRVAARFANLEVLRIMDEPVAAAVAISIQTNIDNSRVLVYDLGGGTFDFTILEVTVNDYRVKATDGDPCLGGADFTNALMALSRKKIIEDEGVDSSENPRLEVELRSVCETIKQELTSLEQAQMDLDLSRYGGSMCYTLTITRSEFESVIAGQIKRSVDIVENCMKTYDVDISSVSGIALVGGSSCIPLIRKELNERFPTLRILSGFDPREVVCRGALVQALSLIDEPDLASPAPAPAPAVVSPKPQPAASTAAASAVEAPALVRPSSYRENPNRRFDEPASAISTPQSVSPSAVPSLSSPQRLSLSSSQRLSASSALEVKPISLQPVPLALPKRPSTPSLSSPPYASPSLAPVASPVAAPIASPVSAPIASPVASPISAPVPAPIPAPVPAPVPAAAPAAAAAPVHDFGKVHIHPTTPLDLGIRVQGKYMSVIIPRNTPLPTSMSKTYQTNEDHPDCVHCCMYQGNDELVANDVKIGIIKAKDIPVYPNVRSLISITFSIDINGVFSVSASVVGSEMPVTIEMLDSVLLTDKMIDNIIDEDKREKEEIIKEMREDLISEIELRLQDLENSDNYRMIALVAREREWLDENMYTGTVEELQQCLDRLK